MLQYMANIFRTTVSGWRPSWHTVVDDYSKSVLLNLGCDGSSRAAVYQDNARHGLETNSNTISDTDLKDVVEARVRSERSKKSLNPSRKVHRPGSLSQSFKVRKREAGQPWKTKTHTGSSTAEAYYVQKAVPQEASISFEKWSLPKTKPKWTINGVEATDLEMRKHKIAYDKAVIPSIIHRIAQKQYAQLRDHYASKCKTLGPKECWIHPSLPRASQTKVRGVVNRSVRWCENGQRLCFEANLGIVMLLHEDRMSDREKEGFVWEEWQLSHLCGNWPCINIRHLVMEPKKVNLNRNACFKLPNGCNHEPRCMKELKKERDELRIVDPEPVATFINPNRGLLPQPAQSPAADAFLKE